MILYKIMYLIQLKGKIIAKISAAQFYRALKITFFDGSFSKRILNNWSEIRGFSAIIRSITFMVYFIYSK